MGKLKEIKNSGVVAVLRGFNPDKAFEVAGTLVKAGIKCIEITIDSPKAFKTISRIRSDIDKVLVGSGTVMDLNDARKAIDAGAEFVFSPVFNQEVVGLCKGEDITVVPGAFTPNEIHSAYSSGADAVKVFPASVLGPEFIEKALGPMDYLPLIPTGGIGAENAGKFIDAGASAVGVGSYLSDAAEDEGELKERSKKLKEVV